MSERVGREDELLEVAMARFDAANAEDPNQIEVDGVAQGKELVFARRLSEWVMRLNPDASVALRLASRCQHICRWEVPRSSEPMGRAGYLKWRAGLKSFHAQTSADILRDVGYSDEIIDLVRQLNLKTNLQTDPDCQTLEDALCLVFLEYQFDALIAATSAEKMIRIVRKSWDKMSKQGRESALRLNYSPEAKALLEACC